MASLQDQLLKAGLADKKKAKKINTEKRKVERQNRKQNIVAENEIAIAAEKALQEEAERSRELNRLQQLERENKALQMQIKQLIESNSVDRPEEHTVTYQFTDNNKIKTLEVSELQKTQLAKGLLAIVLLAEEYVLIPWQTADKLGELNDSKVVVYHKNTDDNTQGDEDDPYADYQIPDDLMW